MSVFCIRNEPLLTIPESMLMRRGPLDFKGGPGHARKAMHVIRRSKGSAPPPSPRGEGAGDGTQAPGQG